MSARAQDRRGDRRSSATPTCGVMVAPVGPHVGPFHEATRCGGELVEAIDTDGAVMYCKSCGTVDRRSTEGNRRRAALELEALCRRIERELGDRVEALEGTVEYHSERASTLESRLEDRRHEIHQLERKVDAVEYTADEAKREADRARQEAERAGRGW